MVPAADDEGKTKPPLSSSFIRGASPLSMLTDGVRTFVPRMKGFSGDFSGEAIGVAGIEDILGLGGNGGGGGRLGGGVIPLATRLSSISSYSRIIIRSNKVRTDKAEMTICGKNPM